MKVTFAVHVTIWVVCLSNSARATKKMVSIPAHLNLILEQPTSQQKHAFQNTLSNPSSVNYLKAATDTGSTSKNSTDNGTLLWESDDLLSEQKTASHNNGSANSKPKAMVALTASKNSLKPVGRKQKCPLPGFCQCSKTRQKMTCGGNLTYIPLPPSFVNAITMTGCCLGNVTQQTFVNVSHVTLSSLELPSCGIRHIGKNAFVGLRFLHDSLLSLSGNQVDVDALRDSFCGLSASNLSRLQLDAMGFNEFPAGLFDCLTESQITSLSLHRNNFTTFSGLVLRPLEKLKTLNLTHNNISYLQDVAGFGNLTYLELRWNGFVQVPRLFGGNLYPKLQTLRLGSNRILKICKEDFKGLRNLIYLELKFNYIRDLPANVLTEMPKLSRLYLKHNNLRTISSYALNSLSLTYLDISGNALRFSTVNKDIFRVCPNLNFLYMTDNILDINDRAVEEFFSPLAKLTRLIIEKVSISSTLPEPLFRVLPSLRELIASSNNIANWSSGIFQHATKLEKLYLDSNKIITISESSFPTSFLKHLKVLNLAGNPFACNCDLMWFRNWLRTTNITIVGISPSAHAYKCHTPAAWTNKPLLSFNPTAESCTVKEPNLLLILSSSLGSFVALVAVTGFVVFRYRMNIRYCCFLARSKLRGYAEIDGDNDSTCAFDAFVVYSSADRDWVMRELSPRVEKEAGFKLCLFDRDFIPGTDIVDNIMTHMEDSRKVILVLSDNFAASEWCGWELTMAQHKLLDERREILILVKLDDIQHCNMTNRLMLLLRDKIYIDWADCELGRDMFWQKLLRSLSKSPRASQT